MTERAIERAEGPLAYHLLGNGSPRVAVLPGWALNVPFLHTTATWAAWETWGQRIPILLLDRRGSGGSHTNRGDVTPEQTAADLFDALNHAGAETVTLWAHADAAFAAMTLAARNPERVQQLVLQAPFARLLAAPDFPHGMPLQAMMALATLHPDAPVMNELAVLGAADGAARDGRARFQASIAPGLLPRLLMDISSADARPVLPMVRTPTLVLHGSEDKVIPPAAGQEVARLIPGARFEIVEGMGHLAGPEMLPALMEHIEALIDEEG